LNASTFPNVDLFGERIEPTDVCVFHDESGDYGHSPWVFTGLLWVRKKDVSSVIEGLHAVRQRENYWREIHFNALPKSFEGQYGPKARVARGWFEKWSGELANKTWFNVLAVQRNHPKYEHKRFTKDFHAYNRFTAMALKAGLAWHFKNHSHVRLWMYSDNKTRRPGGMLGDGIETDNFEDYITHKLAQDTASYKGPPVSLGALPECLDFPGDPARVRPEHELLCLCDVLLGSVAGVVFPNSKYPTKQWFAKQIAGFIQDVRKKPKEQQMGLHRRFSVSYFPSKDGLIYNDGPIRILDEESAQLSLFGGF